MGLSWKWKFLGILGSILLCLYALVPTIFGFAALKEEAELLGKPLPSYFKFFPEKGLNLGLDL